MPLNYCFLCQLIGINYHCYMHIRFFEITVLSIICLIKPHKIQYINREVLHSKFFLDFLLILSFTTFYKNVNVCIINISKSLFVFQIFGKLPILSLNTANVKTRINSRGSPHNSAFLFKRHVSF